MLWRNSEKIWKTGVPLQIVVVLALSLAWLNGKDAAAFRNVEEGAEAPDFALQSTAGKEVSLSSFRGKAVLVAFVRQGQDKSARVLKDLAQLDPALAEQAQVLAVVINPDGGDAVQWAAETGATFPILQDAAGEVYGRYGMLVAPTTGVVGPQGSLRGEVNGYTASYRTHVEGLVRVALGLTTAAEEHSKTEAASGPATTEERKDAERYLGKARILVKRKMKEKAVASAQNAVSADPSYVDAQVFLGTLLLDLSDENADKAQAHFEKALELAPRNVDAKVGVARVKSLQGDVDGAVSILEDAARLNPKPEKTYYELGLVHERAQQYQKAVEAYRKALERLLR